MAQREGMGPKMERSDRESMAGGLTGLLKTLFFAGLGTAAGMREGVREQLDKLVHEGRITAHEARDVLAGAERDGEREWEELRGTVADVVRKVLGEMGVAGAAEMDALRDRVAALEKKVGAAGGAEAQKAAEGSAKGGA